VGSVPGTVAPGGTKRTDPSAYSVLEPTAGGKDPIPTPTQLQASSQTISLRFSENLNSSSMSGPGECTGPENLGDVQEWGAPFSGRLDSVSWNLGWVDLCRRPPAGDGLGEGFVIPSPRPRYS